MFGSIDKSKGLLFVTHDLDHSLRSTMQEMQQEVESLDENRLLNTAPDCYQRRLHVWLGLKNPICIADRSRRYHFLISR